MSHKPLSMKTLSQLSQKPMLHSEKPVTASTMDLMHAARAGTPLHYPAHQRGA